MKKVLAILFLLLFAFTLTACSTSHTYSFMQNTSEIVEIEIGEINNEDTFTATYVLSESEMSTFISDFEKIEFHTYRLGDPSFLNGTTIKITYKNGDYELIAFNWAEQYSADNNSPSWNWNNCDKDDFQKLIDKYTNNGDT